MPSYYHQRFKTPKQRFEEKVKKMESGCHDWQANLHRDGYGKSWFANKHMQSHRVAHILYKGAVPKGKMVLHTCDNRKCVNPEHLYLGDAKRNTADMFDRGRNVGNTRFGMDLVEKAISLYESGMSQQDIADELGIHQTTISKYIRGTQFRQRRNS